MFIKAAFELEFKKFLRKRVKITNFNLKLYCKKLTYDKDFDQKAKQAKYKYSISFFLFLKIFSSYQKVLRGIGIKFTKIKVVVSFDTTFLEQINCN